MIPRCVSIIPDGNRRWAEMNHRTVYAGYERGLLNCRLVARAAFEQGVQHVVLWAASELNLQRRPAHELAFLFKLLKEELRSRIRNPEETGFHLCGAWERLAKDEVLADLVRTAHQKAARYRSQQLTVLFGYSGKTELLESFKKLSESGEVVTEETVRSHLWTSHLPDVDLLLRTGVHGDPHWSDALLPWQMINTQFHFTSKLWPDFTAEDLREVFRGFGKRPRRMGA